MSDIDDEERCIALTGAGHRCTRLAKHGRFCFQHAEMDDPPIADGLNPEPAGFISVVSSELDSQAAQLSGAPQDVAQNLKGIIDEAGSLMGAVKSLDFSSSLNAFKNTVGQTGPSAGTGALLGGVLGSPFGPIGIAAGSTAGGWYGVYRSTQDKRAVAASITSEVPDDATVIPSTHPAIRDVEPIQLAIQSATEREDNEQEWVRSTLTRERNMDAVAEALNELEEYGSEDDAEVYYIEYTTGGTSEQLLLVFGIPEDK